MHNIITVDTTQLRTEHQQSSSSVVLIGTNHYISGDVYHMSLAADADILPQQSHTFRCTAVLVLLCGAVRKQRPRG